MNRWKLLPLICAAFAAYSAGACKGKKKGLTDAERAQLVECTKALGSASALDGHYRLEILIQECGKTLGFDAILDAEASMKAKLFAEKTDYFCNESVGKKAAEAAPEARNAILIEGCGADYYGLTKDTAHHLSREWFTGQRVAAWLADTLSRAGDKDKDAVAAIATGMSMYQAPLPIPPRVPGVYELPSVATPDHSDAPRYVLVDDTSAKAIERPILHLTDKGADLEDTRPGTQPMELAEIQDYVTSAGRGDPEPELVGADGPGVGKPEVWAPLLIADKSLPAARALSVVESMGEHGVHMGALAMGRALQTMVPFGRISQEEGARPKVRAQLLLRDDAMELWIGGETHELARGADGAYPYDVLTQKLKDGIETEPAILISASGNKATYQELVNVLDAARGAGLKWAVTGPGGSELLPAEEPATVASGEDTIEGDLDKQVIRTHIREKLPRIRQCYEKELLVKPELKGTVTTMFQIAPSGSVQGAKASGMGNTDVESCVAAAVKSIQFPKPNNGGYVNVTYPFTFASQ